MTDVKAYIKRCEECQKHPNIRGEEPLHSILLPSLWRKVGLDIIRMPASGGFKYLVALREDLTAWLEAKPFVKSHIGTEENELADQAAKEGTSEPEGSGNLRRHQTVG